jgi:methylenetetrahydrofolate reductase (NADPH)
MLRDWSASSRLRLPWRGGNGTIDAAASGRGDTMKVIDHLAQATRPLISFEIIPPLRGGDVRGLLELIDQLVAFEPPFIDITSHAAQVVYEETPEGLKKRVKRKRPGTLGVCALIQNKYDIDAVPHVLCTGFTREETEDFLIELRYLELCRQQGIVAPIIPGLKILTTKAQLTSIPRTFYAEIPADLADAIVAAKPDQVLDVGVEWAARQARELLEAGVPSLHFYVMANAEAVRRVLERLDL